MTENLLGFVAAVAFAIYAFPQMWTVFRTPRLRGYNLVSWFFLSIASTALLIQLTLTRAWLPVVAQVVNTASVYYIMTAVWRKG